MPSHLPPRYVAGLLLLLTVLLPTKGQADTAQEIGHLLQYIDKSGCLFIRNAIAYDGREARKHIQRKYRHAKRWVNTAEDFIKYAATKSSISGEPYKVRCGDREMLSAEWLIEELHRFRDKSVQPVDIITTP